MELYQYQLEGARWLAGKRRAILCDAPGLGKTAQAIRALLELEPWDLESILIVCPASLRLNWQREWDMWLGRFRAMYPTPVIVSYDKARDDKSIVARTWDIVILDEAHFLKNRKARRSKVLLGRTRWSEHEQVYVRAGGINAKHVWFMTGTPVSTCPADFFNVLHFCAPGEFPDRHGYEVEFCEGHFGPFGWEAKGASQLDKLRTKIYATGVYLRRTKEAVLTQLPPKIRQVVEIPRSELDSAGRQCLAAEQALMMPLDRHAATDGELYELVMQKRYSHKTAVLDPQADDGAAHVHDLRQLLSPAKVQAFCAWARDTIRGTDEKVVVWAHYKSTINALAEALSRLDIGHVVFDGSADEKHRDFCVTEFQKPMSETPVQVFIGSSAAYTGITLTAASRVIFVEPSFIPSDNVQAEDRCHRIGQTHPVFVQYLAVEGSYDLRMMRVIVQRMQTINQLLG